MGLRRIVPATRNIPDDVIVNESCMATSSTENPVQGPPGDVAELFRLYRVPMIRMAYVLTSDSAIAEEIVQDAFLKVHASWPRLDNPVGYLGQPWSMAATPFIVVEPSSSAMLHVWPTRPSRFPTSSVTLSPSWPIVSVSCSRFATTAICPMPRSPE